MEEDNLSNKNSFQNSIQQSLRFPVDDSMQIVFTGFFNGFSVEIRSVDEISLLYHMGCFGKGSASKSKPKSHHDGTPSIIRKRQYQKRNYWFKKFGTVEDTSDPFLKDINELTSKIVTNSNKEMDRNVIYLVSSDEENEEDMASSQGDLYTPEKYDPVVIVSNSDSEGDDYFKNMKPKCCINKIRIQEKLILTLQEAFFLTYGLGSLQVINNNRKLNVQELFELCKATDENFVHKYVVYHYFRSKGYIVKPAIKFGGDYLLYKEGPGVNHADYIVVLNSNKCSESRNWVYILGHVRMAVTTVKDVLLVEVHGPIEDIEVPEALSNYSVKELVLSRDFPLVINEID